MFRAGGISINYRVRGADAENPPDIIRVFKCDSCSSYGMDQGMATSGNINIKKMINKIIMAKK